MPEDLDLDRPAAVEDGFAAPLELPVPPIRRRPAGALGLHPELRLADRFAAGQPVPVPIEQLLSDWAEVTEVDLPEDLEVDAVSISSPDGERGRVLINRYRNNPLRRRFTLAHELAHLALPWHVGSIGCTTQVGVGGEDVWTSQREAEANRFAARLLVPQDWLLNEVVPTPDPRELFASLERAQVSAVPALLRLVPELPFGWMIALLGSGSEETRVMRSPGSFMPPISPRQSDLETRVADDWGSTTLAGRTLRWWVWHLTTPPYPDLKPISAKATLPTRAVRHEQLKAEATKLLRKALANNELGDQEIPHYAAVTGVVIQNATVRTPAALYSAMRQRFSDPIRHGRMIEDADFRAYLATRAWQWSDTPSQLS